MIIDPTSVLSVTPTVKAHADSILDAGLAALVQSGGDLRAAEAATKEAVAELSRKPGGKECVTEALTFITNKHIHNLYTISARMAQ